MVPSRRGLSTLLLAVFLGGGFGLPDADALLFHSFGHKPTPEVAHFDQPGGCGAHSEHCALTIAASAPQVAGSGLPSIHLTDAPLHGVGFASVPSLRSTARSFLHPSRAPPASTC